MSLWTRHERPGSRPARSWVFDIMVALFALAIASLWSFHGGSISVVPLWGAVLIVAAMTGPLVVRRLWPVPVFAWCVLVAAATGWWAMQIVWSPALVVALYTVAALRPRRDAIIACGLLVAGCVIAAYHVLPQNWYGAAGALIAVAVAATGIGLYIGTRRVLLVQLRDRAAQLERERDQQGALAAGAERARIAREMHDIVAHHLTVMVALADGAAVQAERTPVRAAEVMRTVSATGRLALADTRRLLGVLRDDSGPDAEAATRSPVPDLVRLDELIGRVRAAGLTVSYTTEGERSEIAPAIQLTLFRLVQEALTNTMKHGGSGARASVWISYGADEAQVRVDDDGQGGSAAGPVPGAGRGLAGMRERVGAFGGEVVSGPRSPHGWSVSARLRLDPVSPR